MLKAAAAAGALLASVVPIGACADTLLTGAIRDQAGVAIGGARVTAYDAVGRLAGSDVAQSDGTFAIAAARPTVQVGITCDYCRALRRTVEPGLPVVIIVERFAALTQNGPSAVDVRALPYRSAADLASLRPFTVVDGERISDRGLAYEGAVLVDGLPFYRAADANDLSGLVPARATAALMSVIPLDAPVYGGSAGAGVYDVRLRDPDLSTSRFDIGEASDIVARAQTSNADAGYAASSDAGDDRQAASIDAAIPFAGGRLAFDGADLSNLALHASGAGLAYATDSRRFTTAAALSSTQSDAASLLTASAFVRSRGPLQWEYGGRVMRATSILSGAAGTQFDAALYARADRETGISRLSATIAVDRGSDSSSPDVAGGVRGTALVGSLADDVRVGRRWVVHAGAVSNQRIPTFAELSAAAPIAGAADRSLLFEQSVSYTDLQRVRLTGISYTQRTTSSATQHINGIGVDAAWQVTPQLSLRTWVLRGNRSSTAASDQQSPYSPELLPGTAYALTRQFIWLTYEWGVRFDALDRGGALEGDVRIPLDAGYAFSIGTAMYNGTRVTTFGLSTR
jgi:hypothetical protein